MDQEFEKLREIIADVLNVDPNEITEETTFADDLGADSLDLYQILMGLEEEFGMTVDQEAAEKVKTAGDALKLLKSAKGENA